MRRWFIYHAAQRLRSTRLGQKLLEVYQNHLLRQTIHHASHYSPFYQRRFRDSGINPRLVTRREDLAKLGFFTTSADLQNDPFDFLAVPRAELVHLASTTGTTGQPKITFYSKADWANMVDALELSFALMGINQDDVAQVMFNAGTPSWMTGTLLQQALEKRGVLIVPTGNAMNPRSQIEMIKTYRSTCLFSTPSYLHRVTVEASKFLNLADLGVRMIYVGAEPISDELRAYFSQSWGASVRDGYGMMEMGAVVAGECGLGKGMHLALDVMVEVVNPDTGVRVPDGQMGELVLSTLRRKASPLIRYRSGDIARLIPENSCPCDRISTRRISNIQGRADDMIQIGTGENFYPTFLDQAMIELPSVTGYQMTVTQNGYQDEIALTVECNSFETGLSKLILQRLYSVAPSIAYDVNESQTIAEPNIKLVSPGTLSAENPIKIRKVIDKR